MEHPEAIKNLKRRMAAEIQRQGPPDGFNGFPALHPGRYLSDEFFALEQEHLWSKVWLYGAPERSLPHAGSYLQLDIPWADIFLIRGDDLQVRAFYNVCSHRGAPLLSAERAPDDRALSPEEAAMSAAGQTKLLRCRYHNWSYDLRGELVAVAHERDFAPEFDKSCLGLVPLRCEIWEGLVFVNQDPDAAPLQDWLGMIDDEFAQFELASLRCGAVKSYELQCNWKLTMDAFLEVYHIKGIHPKTVGPSLDERGAVMGLLPNGHTRMTCPTNPVGRSADGAGSQDSCDEMQSIPQGEIAREYHVSHNIFPNIITPVSANSRQLLMFWPLAKDRTRVDVVHFGHDWGDAPQPAQWLSHLAFWDVVMDEDLQFLEQQQKAIQSPGYRGYNLSYMERRIYYAHESIDQMIGVERIPPPMRVEPKLEAMRETREGFCA